MDLVDAPPNVELREHDERGRVVVLAFPYDGDVVEAVRGIPGRRFDWHAREWWAPVPEGDDAWVAIHVGGVLERFPELVATREVEAWLRAAGRRWVARISTDKDRAQGFFVAETRGGDLPPELERLAMQRGHNHWLPMTREVADLLAEERSARPDRAATDCLERLLSGLEPPPAILTFVDGVQGERLRLDVLWDHATAGAFAELPGVSLSDGQLPVDPWIIEPVEKFLRDFGVEAGATARPILRALRDEHQAATDAVARSRETAGPPLDPLPRLGGELQPFQHAGVRYVLEARRTFLADEQGLGKTVQALAALEADDAWPAVVVCPASLKLNWEREARHWLPHRTRTVVAGRGGVPATADLVILNYEIVEAHTDELRRRRAKALVLDESHLVKNPRAQRTRAARRLADSLPRDGLRLALTGTPVMNHPDELVSQLRVLDRLGHFGSGARFRRQFKGLGAEERLHWHLRRHCFVRRLKSEVLPQLPAKRRTVVPVAMDRAYAEQYALAERDVIEWLQSQPYDLAELDAKVAAARRAERLAQLNALKLLAARGKLPAALSWIHDFLASDERLVVFAHHREVQEAVLAQFPDALHLLGRDSAQARDDAVRAFQAADGPQLMICSTAVAAQGITLTRATNVCFLELEWTPALHDQAEDRLHRIGQHDAVTAWYLLSAETIDESIARLLERKRSLVAAVTDGREREDDSLIDEVARELRNAPIRHLRVVERP